MSFFGKLKGGSTQTQANNAATAKKDLNAPVPTPLEKHLADVSGPVRPDGSDKYFGFENYGSTCYCNSIIQCLYYSAPFRENVLSFPSKPFLESLAEELARSESNGKPSNGAPLSPRSMSATPYPNVSSPARKQTVPGSPGPGGVVKQEENKDSPEFRKKLALAAGPVLDMTGDNSVKYGMDESLFTSLKDIFEAILGNQSHIGVVSPHKFLEILRRENEMFRSAMHQDAHEFLNLLLNQVVDNVELFSKQHPMLTQQPQPNVNGGAPETGLAAAMSSAVAGAQQVGNGLDTHWVHDLFEGTLTSETRCLTCETTSQRDEAFLDLSVDLSAHTSVTSCLRKFSEEEMLCERNKFHCDNCGGLQEAEKRMKIKRLPRILALHLKRFKYTEDLQRLQKLFHKVVYPFHLRLFNTTDDAEDPDRLYELYAVVVHIGGGPYHGHYVSIIKTQDRGWLLFDDELVEPVDKAYVLSFFGGEPVPGLQDARQLACAYVLFYQETTLEAVLKEQEAEGQQPLESRLSTTDTAEGLSPSKGDLRQTQTVTTPLGEAMAGMDPIEHAYTTPMEILHSPVLRPPFDHQFTTPGISPVMPAKSKKEIKVEEKERKAKEKADQKARELAMKERSSKRVEAYKREQEELKRIMEESKASAVEEARRRGDEAPMEKGEKGGLARFRHGSMSLRAKPKLFGKEKERVPQDGAEKLAAVPQGQASTTTDAGRITQDFAPKAAESSSAAVEEKKLKNRFSLGRKKSALM
ncbi:hypothetical protein LTR36_002993 [Oleoguttula mirabilis]|uniref:Ubiquitin carboxyl-terminal hydrolase n=1 Tax=Oleoguttula mirabilis TaxID=1507867 RepID=A0AAV9JXZ1_9PEZI|nr:hypothetical protein LTR36_002993 [Oleoguttula mirabilis]